MFNCVRNAGATAMFSRPVAQTTTAPDGAVLIGNSVNDLLPSGSTTGVLNVDCVNRIDCNHGTAAGTGDDLSYVNNHYTTKRPVKQSYSQTTSQVFVQRTIPDFQVIGEPVLSVVQPVAE